MSVGPAADPPMFRTFESAALEQNRVVEVPGQEIAEPLMEGTRILVGCGQTWLDQKIAIVDTETLTPCPSGRVGEIWIAGPHVAQGYWNRHEETNHAFRAYMRDTGEGPFLRTGDLGFLWAKHRPEHDLHGDAQDELFITGRLKDLLIIRGRNLYPQDIERTVEAECPFLRQTCCAAFSIEADAEERLVLVAELRSQSLPISELAKRIQQSVLENYEVEVHAISFVKKGTIPKTTSGKIQRHVCRAGFLADTLEVVGKWVRTAEASFTSDESPVEATPPDSTVRTAPSWKCRGEAPKRSNHG